MDAAPTHIPLYADEQALLERDVEADIGPMKRSDAQPLQNFFELDETVQWIHAHNYKKIALQFPDHQLGDSAGIARYIETHATNGCQVFILADTSYGKCCVDEVAAEHVSADALLHYGPACMSATSRLPVRYIFGRQAWNVEGCSEKLKELQGRWLVFFDVQFHHGVLRLKQLLAVQTNIIFSTISTSTQESDTKPEDDSLAHTFCGRSFSLAADTKIEDYSILYIGGEGIGLTNILMHYNQSVIWTYNPIGDELRRESVNANKSLMKRFFLIEKAKDADIIGIVVGTLAVKNYMDILAYLKRIIKAAGKKYYTFVMGKLNIPKLANFAEIDMFVLVACPENSLIDSKDFFRPIVTPFELEIALVKGKEWSNKYSTDFQEVLRDKDLKQLENELMEDGSQRTEGEEVRISLVSNKIKANHKVLAIEEEEANSSSTETSMALTKRANLDIALANVPTASTSFLQRSFQGLEQRLGEDLPQAAVEGRAGIAAEYDDEIELDSI